MNQKNDRSLYNQFLEQILKEFPTLNERIIFYFISAGEQYSKCQCMPYRMVYDMMLVYGIMWENRNGAYSIIPVTNDIMNLWKMQEKDLFAEARKNTPCLLPVCLQPIEEMLSHVLATEEKKEVRTDMYVLTNRNGCLGAAAMLYENVLKRFAESLDSDLYILPSSVHEVILLPIWGQEKEILQNMVVEINEKEVQKKDILSNTVYRYLRKTDQIVK